MPTPDLLLAGSLGLGACWGWLLAPLALQPRALAWAALSTASLVALTGGIADATAATACVGGTAAGWAMHLGRRRRLRRAVTA